MLRLKKLSNFLNFLFVSNLIWGCSKCILLLYLRPEIILTPSTFFWLAVWFYAFSSIIPLFAFWKLLELVYIGLEHKMRRIVSSTSVQDLNRAAPATFRTQIEKIQTHLEYPQVRFKTKWKVQTLFEPLFKKFKCLLKLKERLPKILNIRRLRYF